MDAVIMAGGVGGRRPPALPPPAARGRYAGRAPAPTRPRGASTRG